MHDLLLVDDEINPACMKKAPQIAPRGFQEDAAPDSGTCFTTGLTTYFTIFTLGAT